MLIELNEDNLQNLISDNKIVFVQFSTAWCGDCRLMKPEFKKLALENETAAFVLINVENAPESSKLVTISLFPKFASFINGELVGEIETNRTEILKEFVETIM